MFYDAFSFDVHNIEFVVIVYMRFAVIVVGAKMPLFRRSPNALYNEQIIIAVERKLASFELMLWLADA